MLFMNLYYLIYNFHSLVMGKSTSSVDDVIQDIMALNINKSGETEAECGEGSNSHLVNI